MVKKLKKKEDSMCVFLDELQDNPRLRRFIRKHRVVVLNDNFFKKRFERRPVSFFEAEDSDDDEESEEIEEEEEEDDEYSLSLLDEELKKIDIEKIASKYLAETGKNTLEETELYREVERKINAYIRNEMKKAKEISPEENKKIVEKRKEFFENKEKEADEQPKEALEKKEV